MTVRELIARLQKMPQDAEVFRSDMESADGTADILDVHVEKAVREAGRLHPIDSIQELYLKETKPQAEIIEIVVLGEPDSD